MYAVSVFSNQVCKLLRLLLTSLDYLINSLAY